MSSPLSNQQQIHNNTFLMTAIRQTQMLSSEAPAGEKVLSLHDGVGGGGGVACGLPSILLEVQGGEGEGALHMGVWRRLSLS